MSYNIIQPDQFTPEHKQVINNFRESILKISATSNIIMGAKDVHSRHLIATDAYSKIVNLNNGLKVENLMDSEMPCEGTAKFADSFVREDQAIIHSGDSNANIAILNIHEYGDGLGAKIFCKHLLTHEASQSILGTIYYAHDLNMKNLFNVFDGYINQHGQGCSISLVSDQIKLNNQDLTDYEQVVCFLLVLKWDPLKITDFIGKCRVDKTRTSYESIASLCEKAGLSSTNLAELRDALISMDMHRCMPKSLFYSLISA